MRLPRFGIGLIMAIVALVALDLGAIRLLVWTVDDGPGARKGQALILGSLPLANVLAAGLLIGRSRPASRPFLRGFEVFGAATLGLYIAGASLFANELVYPYLRSLVVPLGKTYTQPIGYTGVATLMTVAAAMLGLPQLAIALAGGFLLRRYSNAGRSRETLC